MSALSRTRSILEGAFDAAVAAADPAQVLAAHLPERPAGRTIVVGAGKAAGQMAAALEAAWDGPLSGIVVTRYGHAEGIALNHIKLREASHPVPDQAGLEATRAIMDTARAAGPDDLVIALVSGGGSALLCQPLDGLDLDDKQAITKALLKSGATIGEMNTVRQRLSAIKGGRLAALAAPARVVTLFISDVPGDDAAIVASGPTVPPLSGESAETVLKRYRIEPSAAVAKALESSSSHPPDLADADARLIASPQISLEAAADYLSAQGWRSVILSDRMEGESREVAKALAAISAASGERAAPFAPPVAILSGGETTVTVAGSGRGGRNAEFALSSALALRGIAGVAGLAADTDGIDGIESNAGALFDGETCERMREAGIDPAERLADNDAFSAFEAIGDLVTTGPTGTNVNDFRITLVGA